MGASDAALVVHVPLSEYCYVGVAPACYSTFVRLWPLLALSGVIGLWVVAVLVGCLCLRPPYLMEGAREPAVVDGWWRRRSRLTATGKTRAHILALPARAARRRRRRRSYLARAIAASARFFVAELASLRSAAVWSTFGGAATGFLSVLKRSAPPSSTSAPH